MAVNVIDTIKPKNGGSFPVVEAVDVSVSGSQRLSEVLDTKAEKSELAEVKAAVANKANQSSVDSLSAVVANKANQSSVDSLAASVATKASQVSLDSTNAALTQKANISAVEALAVEVSSKADEAEIEEFNTELDKKADKSAINPVLDDLQGQIDQIVISASAESVVAPEVAAARVDLNGQEHNTLKARIDYDVNEINANLANSVKIEVETVEGYVDSQGQIQVHDPNTDNEVTTDYISVNKGLNIFVYVKYKTNKRTWLGYCFYDKNKNFIGTRQIPVENVTADNVNVVIPVSANSAKYIRITWREFDYADVSLGAASILETLNELLETDELNATSLHFQRAITGDDDLDNIKSVGSYTVPHNTSIQNLPSDLTSTQGYLFVLGQNGNDPKLQMYYNYSQMLWYTRYFVSAQWGDWNSCNNAIDKKIPTKVLIPVHQISPIIYNGSTFKCPSVCRLYAENTLIDISNKTAALPTTFISSMCLVYNTRTEEIEVVRPMYAKYDYRYLIAFLIFAASKDSAESPIPALLSVRSLADIDYTYGKPLNLNVCTYNIGLYNYGESGRYSGDDLTEKIQDIKEFIANNNFDILCLQESSTYIDADETVPSFSTLLEGAFAYNYAGNFYLTISSKYPLIDKTTGYFTAKYDDNRRGYVRATALINGKRVAIFSCHTAWEPEAVSTRRAQMEEIISMLQNEERAIVFGDWNVADVSEFSTLINAGYHTMNGGYLAYERTYNYDQDYSSEADTSKDRFFDNIFVKGDVKGFRHVHNIYDKSLSDHLPLSAEMSLN